jgi:hypothetical protein
VFSLDRLGAEHDLVIVRIRDGPAHRGSREFDDPVLGFGDVVLGGGQDRVELDQSLLSDDREQLSLIREMTVWGRGADPRAARSLDQREDLRPFLCYEAKCSTRIEGQEPDFAC